MSLDDPEARILTGLSVEDYYADRLGLPGDPPTLSASIGKKIVEQTPAHAQYSHPKLKPEGLPKRESTEAQTRGILTHRLVLGQGGDIVTIYADDYKKKVHQEERDEARDAGKIPVLVCKLEEATKCANRIIARLRDQYGIDLDGDSEVPIYWTENADDGTLVHCKGMVDHLRPKLVQAVDLKTLESADIDSCEKQISSYDHDIQEAAYTSGLRKLFPLKEIDFGFAFAEFEAPNAVTFGRLDGMARYYGQRRWRLAINRWAECVKNGTWPAYYAKDAYRFQLKGWKVAELEGRFSA